MTARVPDPDLDAAQPPTRATLGRSESAHPATNDRAGSTIAAEIGLGGLGRYIIDGLAASNYGEVAGGAAVIVVLALVVQVAFVGLRRLVVPTGLRQQARASSR